MKKYLILLLLLIPSLAWGACTYTTNGDGSGTLSNCSIDANSDYCMQDGGSVTSGSYWVCSFVKADAANVFSIDKDSLSATVYYRSESGYYATPPANLGGMYNHATLNNHSAYISVGP